MKVPAKTYILYVGWMTPETLWPNRRIIPTQDALKIVLTSGLDLLVGKGPASSSNSSCTPSMTMASSMLSTAAPVKRCSSRTSQKILRMEVERVGFCFGVSLSKWLREGVPLRKGHDWPSFLPRAQKGRAISLIVSTSYLEFVHQRQDCSKSVFSQCLAPLRPPSSYLGTLADVCIALWRRRTCIPITASSSQFSHWECVRGAASI